MEKYTVLKVNKLKSKNGNDFEILKLKNTNTGEVGDYANFQLGEFAEGNTCHFSMVLNYRYQWTAVLVKC